MAENNKNMINDDELDAVSGGLGNGNNSGSYMITCKCPKCGTDTQFRVASGGRAYCVKCNTQIFV